MSEENVALVPRNYEVINSIDWSGEEFADPEDAARCGGEPLEFTDLGDAVVVQTKIAATGRGSDLRIEADETDVFWFRDGNSCACRGSRRRRRHGRQHGP